MLANLWACWRAASRFGDYRPQIVTLASTSKWIKQFDRKYWPALRVLLERIIYFSETDTIKSMTSLNGRLLHKLSQVGIDPTKVIYVQTDAAGSSSAAMLNLLRDSARLERKRCSFVDSKNVMEISDLTNSLEEGAIVYVDDFIGTGKQFARSQRRVREYVVGNFSEFFLAPCVCEEGLEQLVSIGVEPTTSLVHKKSERPLHHESTILNQQVRDDLRNLCLAMHPEFGLGFKGLATMVILYRNAPNTVPLILRGNLNQQPLYGILPRTTDLPVE